MVAIHPQSSTKFLTRTFIGSSPDIIKTREQVGTLKLLETRHLKELKEVLLWFLWLKDLLKRITDFIWKRFDLYQ